MYFITTTVSCVMKDSRVGKYCTTCDKFSFLNKIDNFKYLISSVYSSINTYLISILELSTFDLMHVN